MTLYDNLFSKSVQLQYIIVNLIFSDMSVDILVAYEAPPDFDLPSPPYFRPGSSLTLHCVPQGSSQSIQYQWLSISSQSFTHGSTSSEVHDNTLTLYDAGLHTCTITDTDGSTTSHSIQITLYGTILTYTYNVTHKASHSLYI